MGLPACAPGHAAAAPEGGRLRARCRVQTGRQWPSPGRPQAARESDARSNCCTRRSHDDCATATGWPAKRRPIAPLAVPLARPHRAVRPCRSAGTLSARVSPNRCSLALRAPMHACRQAELAGRTPSAPLDGRMCRLRARVLAYCPVVWESRWPRSAAGAHWALAHTVGAQPPSRTAGSREARGACGGRLRGAAHPLRQLAAAAQIGAHSASPPQRQQGRGGTHTPHPIDIRATPGG